MKLNDFLTSNRISMATFADSVKTTTATVSRIADGIVLPRKSLIHRIYQATDGAVTPNDLVGLYCVRPCQTFTGDSDYLDNDVVESLEENFNESKDQL